VNSPETPEPRAIIGQIAPASDYDPHERSLQLALAAAQTAEEDRGRDILVLDLRELTCIFDYFVIVSGTSRRQLHAISEDIDHKLEDDLGDKRMGIEGYRESSWILLDYGTVVIHLFEESTRDYYSIEKLWGEAKHVPWQELCGQK
jgi:ribosome-associated protein